MKAHCKTSGFYVLRVCLFLLPLLICGKNFAQLVDPNTKSKQIDPKIILNSFSGNETELFGSRTRVIENIGQYGDTLPNFGKMGKILYGYEGFDMPVLFTPKGLIHLQRQTKKLSYQEKERLEKKGITNKNPEINKVITMEWVNANANPQVISQGEYPDYFSYGLLKDKAKAFKKIIYKELYPGIDLVYSFNENKKTGFEYSFIAGPGADISKIKMKYGADIKNIRQDMNGNVIIGSDIQEISVTNVVCYYADDVNQKISSSFSINKNEISFILPESYNKEKTVVIDPFVSGTGGLSGSDAGKAKDIDFDYAGNIYVAGGGDGSIQKLAKYNSSGVLQWTFNGSLSTPSWNFGGSHGGWVVEKISGNIYLGQGLAGSGFRIIRLSSQGLYDNYITNANSSFAENWKMLWNCNGGIPRIFIAGGGSTSNIELAYLSPPSTMLNSSNITGINTGHNDISDILTDPVTNDMYSIFSTSVLNSSADNRIYKHKPPYSTADILWSSMPGYFALREPSNRPYMGGLDNSSNTLAVNSRYLFYWDGRNLKAFNKSDGTQAGVPVIIPSNTMLMQGGVIADECNNVFIGSSNGTIKVYQFNGNTFDDNAAADITITGQSSRSVYDLVYDHGKNLLYACGNGFIASIDLSAYCMATVYTVDVNSDCSASAANAVITPAPPAGAVVTYNLFDGTTLIASNTTGAFTNLTSGKNYTIVAMINQACSGMQAVSNFTLSSSLLLNINNPAAICNENTADLTASSVTSGSTAGLNFTYWLDAAATIACSNPAAVKPGTYFIKATSNAGCSVISKVDVAALPSPIPDAGPDTNVCIGNTLQLKGSGGANYSWSPSTYLSDTKISNPVITSPGNTGSVIYHLKVKDVNGCESVTDDQVKISFVAPAKIFIGNDTMVATNQPLQLNVVDINNTGLSDFIWSPTTGLNNPFIKNPIAVLDKETIYNFQATDANKCLVNASISIKIFRGAEIYVPNSFTPNGDGLNDVLKPVPVGLAEFHYLKIFNRFGQLLFTITDPSKGWDGKINGTELGYGAYIWIGEGIDFKGNLIMRKGATLIIR